MAATRARLAAPKRSVADRVRERLERGYWPRVHCMLIVSLSSAAAFVVTFLLIIAGVRSMPVRYGIAAVAGYLAFLALIRAWVGWKSSRLTRDSADEALNVLDPTDLLIPRGGGGGGGSVGRVIGGGGRSGGGGASASFQAPVRASSSSTSSSGGKSGGGISLDLDADDLFWLIVALVAVFAGVAAIGYVIYVAPTLLAEAAVNGAVAGKVYRGMKKQDSTHWTTQVVRRTVVSATVVILSAMVFGYALQRIAPEAVSIGGVWQHLHR